MRAALPPYSGPDAVCVKCGYDQASTVYVPRSVVAWDDRITVANAPAHDEYLRRECLRCGYQWAEAVLG